MCVVQSLLDKLPNPALPLSHWDNVGPTPPRSSGKLQRTTSSSSSLKGTPIRSEDYVPDSEGEAEEEEEDDEEEDGEDDQEEEEEKEEEEGGGVSRRIHRG